MTKIFNQLIPATILSALLLSGCTPSGGGERELASTIVDEALGSRDCAATSRTINSVATSNGQTQSCVASLARSKSSSTAILASVTNGGSYSLICRSTGQWSSTPTISNCPPPAVVAPTPSPTPSPVPVSGKSRGIRLDPSYFYNSHSGQTPTQIATDVITTLKNARVSTIYLYAYNAVHGAYYPTTYTNTSVEAGYGVQNIFGVVSAEARRQNLKVVAVVPLNNFKLAWQNNSAWRVKQAGGVDYLPLADTYLLSASSSAYKNWYVGFINDLITRNPNIDQVEAVEPTLDYFWSGIPDQNPDAVAAFNLQYPTAAIGSASWLNFRAQEFLNLVAIFNQTVHARNIETCLVHTWTVKADGTLMDNKTIKDNTGFDFIGVATLSGASKTDNLVSEFIWQQWFSEYATSVFNPEWISTIAASYTNTLRNAGSTSNLIIHVEISTFSGSRNTTVPTKAEFGRTMAATAALENSVSVYDYNQIRTQSAFAELSQW